MEALLVVDIQNDFLPGGALAVPRGDEVVPVANRLMPAFALVVGTQDWHPADHLSFARQHPGKRIGETVPLDGIEQILWPAHCVQGSMGARFASGLRSHWMHRVFRKGTDVRIDSYGGFFDNGHRKATGLHDYFQACGVDSVVIVGLALDVCVKFTALDAAELGYRTRVVEEGVRGVELNGGDIDRACSQMREAGVEFVPEAQFVRRARSF